MTQHDLAKAARVPQSTIARIEAGAVTPMTATLMALLRATGHELTVEPMPPAVDREAVRKRLANSPPSRTRQALGRRGKDRATSPIRTVLRLSWFGVPFIVVGDLAEAVHGWSGPVGRTIEVCMASTDEARERLARAREDLGERASPARLRVITETAAGDDYDVLSRNAARMFIDSGITARVAALEDLLRARRARGEPQDREVAAELAAILEERVAKPIGGAVRRRR